MMLAVCTDTDVGSYVLVEYDGIHYPGIIEDCKADEYLVNVMEHCRGGWRWPRRKDAVWYKTINKILSPPVPVNSRGLFVFNDAM